MKIFKYMLLAILVVAGPAHAEDLTGRIQKQYEALKSFSAEFDQTLTNAASGQVEQRSGRIHFKQPRFILWKTETPETEILLIGKDAVWNYFPEEEVAYRYPLEQVLGSKTVLRFLSGKADLKEDFYIERQPTEEGRVKLVLTPVNPEPSLVEATVWVEPDSALITKVLVVDFYANTNLVDLDNLILNPDLRDSMFHFEPPKGVDVFDNTQ
jgi:outer membrane lipoprotein carrier protein